MQTSAAALRFRALVVSFLAVLGFASAASAAEVVHSCLGSIADGYGAPVGGAHVRFWLTRPDNPVSVLAGPIDGITGADGRAAATILYDKATPVELHCKVVPDGLPHKIQAYENVAGYHPQAPFGQQVTVTAEMAPDWASGSGTNPNFPGRRTDAPDHGSGHARLYQSGAYDRVVVIPQGMDFFERTDGRATADDLWFTFSGAMKALHARGYDVWLFRPFLTGQNIHEQAAEFAQAIQHAAGFGPGAQGGKVVVAGYSLGALVARIATARWEADEDWRNALGLEEAVPPANLVAFMDGALRGANVSRKLQDTIWEKNGQVTTNLASCSAGQLLRDSKMCAGSGCFDKFFHTGDGFVFYDGNGTCDAHDPYNLGEPCICNGGPAIETINGDGFPHAMPTVAFSAGTWNPPMNLCYGGARDRNNKGQDICPHDPGGNGAFAPQLGDHWLSVRLRLFGVILGTEHFAASAADLGPGSRFTLAFEDDPRILSFLGASNGNISIEPIQNFAFTFIPIDSALAGDSEDESPFPPGNRATATYQAVHDRPPDELLGWMFGKFDEAYGDPPCNNCGGGSAPTAPGNLVASPVVGGWDQIDLTWEDRSNNEDQFVVQRLLSGEPAWRTIATLPANATSFHDDPSTGLRIPTPAEGTLFYFYRVFARNDYGSGESNHADTRLYNEPPGVSDTLRPRGCIDDLLPELSWRGGDRSTSYYVRLLDAQTGQEAMPDAETTVTHLRPSVALEPRKPYMLRVWGQNNVGWGTGSSPEFFRTFCEPVDPPEFLEPVGCTNDLTPLLKWTPVTDALSYHVRVYKVVDIEHDVLVYDGGPTGPSVEIPAAQALEPGKDYRVWVKPHTAGSSDPYSRIRFFTTMCDQAPGAGYVSPISPGLASTNRPEFLFEVADRADSYRLEVYDPTGTQLAYAREYSAASVCANGLCSVRPDVSLTVGVHAWWVRAGRNFVFDPYAMWGKVTVPALPTVSIGPASAGESSGGLSFPVTLSAPAVMPVTLALRTEDGTALQNADYLPLSGSWTIPAGASAMIVTVPLVDDAVHEQTETLGLRLVSVDGALVGTGVATGTIADDDPLPYFVPGSTWHPEAGPVTEPWSVPIGLVGRSDQEVVVDFTVESCTATAGEDFVAASGQLHFAPGETVQRIPLTVFDDAQPEGHEIVRVTLSNPQGGVITDNWAQATLVNDDPPSLGRARSDFDGDGNNDLVLRDPAGNLKLWRMVGVNRIEALPFTPAAPADANWKLAAVADFNGDTHPDLVWRNENSGRLSIWFMAGTVRQSAQLIDGMPDLVWKLVGTGRFRKSSTADLVWRNATTGELKIWLMDGALHTADVTPTPSQPADANWVFQGVGDFEGDGRRDDLLWRNATSGRLVAWLMDGTVRRTAAFLTPDNTLDWRVAALADVDSDGTTDVVWQRDNPSRVGAWLMRGTNLTCPMFLTPREPEFPGGDVVAPR